jgi:gamma-glutamyltranspeptidase/glutathione hydrolase
MSKATVYKSTILQEPHHKVSIILFCVCFLLLSSPVQLFAKTNFQRGVVVSKNEIASQVGAQILAKGGNAIDGAVATGYALSVLEPKNAGIGGGGFALVYIAKTKELKAIDFRERAPEEINQHPYDFRDGPKSAGIPGTVAGFEYLRKNYGKKSRSEILSPVIKIAREGFSLNKTSQGGIEVRQSILKSFPASAQTFLPAGLVPQVGDIIKEPDLAETLQKIKDKGEDEFYKGNLAQTIATETQKAGGFMKFSDLQNYKVYELQPICGNYRSEYKVCSFPPPSSGGVCLIEALNILENFNLPSLDYRSAERLHYLIEALRFSFADRANKLGDPRFAQIATSELTSKEYAKQIAQRILQSKKAIPSDAVFQKLKTRGKEGLPEKPETTHFTVADKEGNIVAITFSLNGPLGSGFVVPGTGILLNNTLDDFSLPSAQPNQYGLLGSDLNAPQAGKTPLSSMSPTIVFNKDNQPILALGSPGGPSIISAVLNVLLAVIDHKLPIEEAVAAGRLHHQWKPDDVYAEKDLVDKKTENELKKVYNHKFPRPESAVWKRFYWTVEAVNLNWKERKLTGASDPRAEQGLVYE